MNKKQLAIDAAMPVFFIAVALYVIVKAQGMGSEGIFRSEERRVGKEC